MMGVLRVEGRGEMGEIDVMTKQKLAEKHTVFYTPT